MLIGQYARVPTEDDLVAVTPENPVGSLGGREAIRVRAEDLNRAHERVHLTHAGRPKLEAEWRVAAQAFRAAEATFWHAVDSVASRIPAGDSSAIDEALDFLEVDPWCFRSGYAKELLLRRMGGRTLSPTQVARLAGIGRSWVDGPPRREFRDLCRVATRQVPELRSWALTRLGAGEARERLHALWLFTAFPLTDLTDAEITLVQRSLVEFVGGDRERWRHGEWLEYVARAVVTDDWQEQLQRAGLDADPPGFTELILLASLPRLSLTTNRRQRLHDLILSEAERPTDSLRFEFESLARLSADEELLAKAEELMQHTDATVAMHAWWIKRQVLIAQGRYDLPRSS